jgi:hypothetical protein
MHSRNIQPGSISIIYTFNYYDLAVKEGEGLDFTDLELNLLNIATVFLIEIKQADVAFTQLRVLLAHVNNSSNKSLGVHHWQAKLIELIGTELFLKYILDDFEVLIKASCADC